MNIQGWFPRVLTGLISLMSTGLSKAFSNTTVQKHQFFSAQPSLRSNSHIRTWLLWLDGKTIALTRWSFVGKVVSLLFNTQSRFVIAVLPRSKCLLISWLQSLSAVILEPKKIKSVTVSSSVCHEVIQLDAMILVLWMLSFKPSFSLSSFTFIKRLFSSSLLSVIRVISSAYMKLLIRSLALCMMYTALTYYFLNLEPVHGSMSGLTVVSWPAYRLLRRQVRWSGIRNSLRIFQSLWWSIQSKALA